jgi:hypothetical protein
MRLSLACSTPLDVTITFGGKAWPVSGDDMKFRSNVAGLCIGAIFDFNTVNGITTATGPSWVIGAAFLVCFPLVLSAGSSDHAHLVNPLTEKRVFCISRHASICGLRTVVKPCWWIR